jgi:hypothetical protein
MGLIIISLQTAEIIVAQEAQTYASGITSTSASIVVRPKAMHIPLRVQARQHQNPPRNQPQAASPAPQPVDWLESVLAADTLVFNF